MTVMRRSLSADDRTDAVDAVQRHLGLLKHCAAAAGRHGDGLSKVMDSADSSIMRAQKHAHALGADAVIDRLDKAEQARLDIADAVDALRERIADMARHVGAAQDHADALDGGAAKALRQRQRDIAAVKAKMYETDALMARRYPAPPSAFKVVDRSRQVEVVLAGDAEAKLDLSEYEAQRGILREHKGDVVAWCASIYLDPEGRLCAVAQFPPKGVSAASDGTFNAIRRGKLRSASVGLSIIDRADGAKSLRE